MLFQIKFNVLKITRHVYNLSLSLSNMIIVASPTKANGSKRNVNFYIQEYLCGDITNYVDTLKLYNKCVR